jgi:hypothetical protein
MMLLYDTLYQTPQQAGAIDFGKSRSVKAVAVGKYHACVILDTGKCCIIQRFIFTN